MRKALTLFLVVLFAGCATRGPDLSRYVRDGVQYGKTEGRFRGRWWNYYERGRSFLDGRFWQEAEKDFRVALAQRRKDQRWARTYGLHFTREYFPHRELGISLFYQSRLEEAIDHFETSLDDEFSGRAAFYLDEARSDWVTQENLDSRAPAIEILSPDTSQPVTALEIEITGVVRDDTFVRAVSVNGERVSLRVSSKEIHFSHLVRLSPGTNRIEVQAFDVAGKTTTIAVALRTDHDGPAVSFDSPVVVPGTIRGVAFDSAGIRSFSVAGRNATLAPTGEGLVSFELPLDSRGLEAPLLFRCEDKLGNETMGQVPLDALLVSGLGSGTGGGVVLASMQEVARVGEGLDAVYHNGRLLALVLAANEDPPMRAPRVEFTNLEEGQRYLKDEIVVGLKVASARSIEHLEINGITIEGLIPGRKRQRLSRRIRLTEEGPNTIRAAARDEAGGLGQASVSVTREPNEVEKTENKLSVAILGYVTHQEDPQLEGEAQYVLEELKAELVRRKRFGLVERELLPVLQEKELIAALGQREDRARLQSVVQADVLAIMSIRSDGADGERILSVEIKAVNSDTSEIVAYPEATGPAADLDTLVEDLALNFEQEFPRVQGLIVGVRSARNLISDLSRSDRIRRNMKCIVFRKEDFIDSKGVNRGPMMTVITEGLINDVQERLSTIRVPESAGDEDGLTVEELDLVLTK